ncbi:MAG: hypothetical protein CVV52_09925 [Spirochaetae bacterium HGW-Spirochaetae-8]|jgi:hypothetical protein|nr:MAG: hypothetical protein CVV52_09925 [Spirochaetae bacterium HGW-Spirochaetae-8]
MKDINTRGRALESGVFASSWALGVGYLTLLSWQSLGNGIIRMLPFRSLRWRITTGGDIYEANGI